MEKIPEEKDKIFEIEDVVKNYDPSNSSEDDASKLTELEDMVSNTPEIAPQTEVNKNEEESEIKEQLDSIFRDIENDLGSLEDAIVAKNKQGGLLTKLGLGKKPSIIEKDYKNSFGKLENILNDFYDFIDSGNSYYLLVSEEQRNLLIKADKILQSERILEYERKLESERKSLIRGVGKGFEIPEAKVSGAFEKLSTAKKIFFQQAKKLLGNKNLQCLVGIAIIGLAIAAPPTGALSLYTFGLLPGFLPASLSTMGTAVGGAIGGLFAGGALRDLIKNIKVKDEEVVKILKEEKSPEATPITPTPEATPITPTPEVAAIPTTEELNNDDSFDRFTGSSDYQKAQERFDEGITRKTEELNNEESFDRFTGSSDYQKAQEELEKE